MRNKRALIIGILGQDGSYMAELLSGKGYEVCGIVRQDTDETRIQWLKELVPGVEIYKTDITRKLNIRYVIYKIAPTEIYN